MKNRLGKKHILFIEHLSSVRGGQKVLLDIIRGAKENYRISVIVPEEGKFTQELKKIGIIFHTIPMGNYNRGRKTVKDAIVYFYFMLFLILRFLTLIPAVKPDLIYINGARAFIPATLAASFFRVPVIWHIHVLFQDRLTRLLFNFLGRFNTVKKIICVSRTAKNQFPLLHKKSIVIYNGIDTKRYFPSESFTESIKKEFSLKEQEKLIGVIGALIPEKGHEEFIKAAKKVTDDLSNVKFLIVGNLDSGEKNYVKKLKNLIKKLSLQDKIIFTGFRRNIPEIMNALSVTCVTSFEACPMVVLESMACGTPVVGSRLGGTVELIEDGKNGLLYEPGDIEDLVRKILFLLENSEEYLRMSKYARKVVEEKFNIGIFVKNIKNEIKSVLSEA